MRLVYSTPRGKVYQADCLELLRSLAAESVHTIFADPPFNLKKDYGKRTRDNLKPKDYMSWSKAWLTECIRLLAPGGALFAYNLPSWLIEYGAFLNSFEAMRFKHWIAIDKAHSLPIPNRLSPSHYGMLYYIKGEKPRVFNRDLVRTPGRSAATAAKTSKITAATKST